MSSSKFINCFTAIALLPICFDFAVVDKDLSLFAIEGIKVGGMMSRINSWDEIVNKLLARLSKWKMKTLSIDGRLTLLKSVLAMIDLLGLIKKNVGNGKDTLFWEDVWKGNVALKLLYPRVYELESFKKIIVAAELAHDNLGYSLRHYLRGGAEFEQWISSPFNVRIVACLQNLQAIISFHVIWREIFVDDGSEDVNPFGGGNPGFHDDHYDNPLLTKETESEPIIWDIGDEEEEYPFVNKYPSFQEEPIVLVEEESCPVYDTDNEEEESMPVYDTDIEDVIEEEEGFVGKGGFGGEEDNIEDVVVVANDLCSSMIQTILSVDFKEDINTKSHELMSFGKSIIIKTSSPNSFLALVSMVSSLVLSFHDFAAQRILDDKSYSAQARVRA
ncbi:hypothetical protein Tco_0671673 [Tanacetum coccineum]